MKQMRWLAVLLIGFVVLSCGGGSGSSGPGLASIVVTSSNSVLNPGATSQLIATGRYSDGSTRNLTSDATWNSSNTAAVTVKNASRANGFAVAVASGSANITATYNGVIGKIALTVAAGHATQMGGSVQQDTLDLLPPVYVTTIAGAALSTGSTDSIGISARFYRPAGVTTDGTNLYIAENNNFTIRKMVISTGAVTTLAGSALMGGTTDGTGTSARFSFPDGITTDGTNLYIADAGNNTIRRMVISTGVVSTITGSATSVGSIDGTGTAARFYAPGGITTDGTNLYIADTGNHTIRRMVIPTGEVTTIAGAALSSGSADGTGTAARFNRPVGITTDGTNLYVADTYNHTLRKIVISTGVVTTLAGTAGTSGSADGDGSIATFKNPGSVTTDGFNLYVADTNNSTIRKVGSGSGGSAPSPPSGYTVSFNGTSATLSWDDVAWAVCYDLYYSTSSNLDTVNSTKMLCINSPVTMTGLSSGATYYHFMTSINGYGESAPSAVTKFTMPGGGGGGNATYYWANWSCGNSSQCAGLMGGSTGSTGPMCSITDCNAWGQKYIPAGYSCSTTATYTKHTGTMANGVCAKDGVDF